MADVPNVQEIKDAYMNDEINARQYHHGMWKLSRDTFEQKVLMSGSSIGVVKATMNQMWQDLSDRYQEILTSNKSEEVQKEIQQQIKRTGKIPETIYATPEDFWQRFMGDLQAVGQAVNRVPELSGMGWKYTSAALGAPKWMSEMIGFAAETAASTVLTGKNLAKTQADVATMSRGAVGAIKGALNATAKKAPAIAEAAAPVAAEGAASGALNAGQLLAALPEGMPEQALRDVAKYDNPLQAKLAAFSKESADKARGVLPTAASAKLSPNQMRRASHQITAQRAAELEPISLEGIGGRPAGTILNAEQTLQTHNAIREPLEEMMGLAEKVVDGDPDAGLAFEAAAMRLADPLQTTRASQTEAGRATEILRASPVQDLLGKVHDVYAAFAPEIAANGNWEAARAKFAGKLMELGTDDHVAEVYRRADQVLGGEKGKSYGQLFREIYNSLLLAKPATWMKKTFGDIQGSVDKTVQYSMAGWMSPDDKGVLKSDGPLAVKAMLQSFMHTMGFQGGPEMRSAMALGVQGKNVTGELAKFTGKGEARSLSGFFDYGGDPEKWNVPGRVFETVTSMAQNTGSLFGQYMAAAREGTRAGYTGDALATFTAFRMQNPTKEGLLEGINAAGDITMTNPLGGLGKAVQSAVQGWGPAWMITPFFHIPANIVNRAFSNIPGFNLFSRGLAADLAGETGEVARDLALGRVTMGQMSSQFLWLMAKGGMLSGGGPINNKERQVWLEAGNKPYSFKFGDHYFPVAWLGALGMQASVVADAAYISDYADKQSVLTMAGSMTVAAAKAISHEPFFEAWGRLSESLQDPEKSGLSALASGVEKMAMTPASVLTGGPVVSTIARETDPTYKAVDNIIDDVKQNIPWIRSGVPNRLNPLTGETEQLPAPWGLAWLRSSNSYWSQAARSGLSEVSPIQDVPISKDPVMQHLQQIGATFPNFKMSQGTQPGMAGVAPEPGQAPPVNLTAAESEQLIKHYATRKFDGDNTLYQSMQEQMADPDYKESPLPIKKQVMESLMRANLSGAFDEYKATNPEVNYRYATSQLKKLMDKAGTPEEKDQIQQDYLQSQNTELNSLNLDLQADSIRARDDYNRPAIPPDDLGAPMGREGGATR